MIMVGGKKEPEPCSGKERFSPSMTGSQRGSLYHVEEDDVFRRRGLTSDVRWFPEPCSEGSRRVEREVGGIGCLHRHTFVPERKRTGSDEVP